jgi:hypothetical protein
VRVIVPQTERTAAPNGRGAAQKQRLAAHFSREQHNRQKVFQATDKKYSWLAPQAYIGSENALLSLKSPTASVLKKPFVLATQNGRDSSLVGFMSHIPEAMTIVMV